ncbi:cytoplasmic dynein 1 light intermediate chain 2 isoform x2 [Limosa lapponica baueri]|uniref:Dynein light intermediate chain n=1 Tax=Limosa lapponica baueri TaxID=1758121 RepID=A0A2I0TIT0_LIMLA|nr:cytoplasmic dynein 1 light intermediate chain 2 isoform x2 [Limosa lapponica baueri]
MSVDLGVRAGPSAFSETSQLRVTGAGPYGEDGAGKTSLIGKIQGIEEYKKGRGMEYLYLNVHDEDRDVVRDFQEYIEPGEDFPASPQRRNTSLQEDKDDSVILPLGADTLTCNLGIPVVVVCTKCDAISVLEKEHDYRDEHFDFIQSHIRRFCLQCQKPVLTDVQAELDRISRKPEMVSPTTPASPTEGEAS